MTNHNTNNKIDKISAQELALMVNQKSVDLFSVDIAKCTDWYKNDDYMEETMSYIEDDQKMDEFIGYVLLLQEHETCIEHNPRVCYRVIDERKYAPYIDDLAQKLEAIRIRVHHKREIDARLAEMQARWAASTSISCSAVSHTAQTLSSISEPILSSTTCTTSNISAQYHIKDLPQDVQNNLFITDDLLYSDFVETLKGPVCDWVSKHNQQDWNVVRFICKLRGIVSKKCSIPLFAKFLSKLGLGNQEHNMKKRQDANNSDALVSYDLPSKNNDRFWQLKIDGKVVEELLEDIIKKIA